MRHIFGCVVRFTLFFGYYCCQSILELLTPDFSAEILSFDRHSEFIKLFSSMCYDREQLFSLRRENLKPTRSVRKSIFRNRLWLPASARNAWSTESHVTGGLSTPAPDLDLLPQGIPDVTSSAPVITKHQQKQSGCSIKFGLLNAQSVGNKFTAIHGEIVDGISRLACSPRHGTQPETIRPYEGAYLLGTICTKLHGRRKDSGRITAVSLLSCRRA